MIETRDLWRSFDRTEAVRGLDLRIESGEIYGFLGPNGAGKTTTLRILAGLLQPTRGEVRIDGHTYRESGRELRRIVGFAPDTPPLHDYLTGRQYVALVAGLWGVSRRERDIESERLFATLDLEGRIDELCKGYSHGMRRKIHLAAVLTTRPRVLLLDEPTSGLDPRANRALKDLLRNVRAEGATILLSTHVLDAAEELSDRIGILAGGELRAQGSPAELRAARGSGSLEDVFLDWTT